MPARPEQASPSARQLPARATLWIAPTDSGAPEPVLSLFFDMAPTDLLAKQTWDVPVDEPGWGGDPSGRAGAAVADEEGSGSTHVTNGRLLLERGDGFIRGTVITNTPRGSFTFEGGYALSCSFLAYPEQGYHAFVKPDPTFESADCAPFASLQPNQ